MENKGSIYDVAIIGAGVAGIYASYCCGVSGFSCVLFDTLSCAGGQCAAFYPDKKVYGVPGIFEILSRDFVGLLKSQASSFDSIDDVFSEKIVSIRKNCDVFSLESKAGEKYRSRNLILATGIGDMIPNMPLHIVGVTSDENSSFVQYYCMKMDLYRGKRVIIGGGGDSAADFAINISTIAKNVIIIHRRESLTCDNEKLELIRKIGNIELKLSHGIKAIEAGRKVITDQGEYEADYIVFCYGFRSAPDMISGLEALGVVTENNLICVDFRTMQTGNDRVFAIGDAITYQNKKKNIVSCFFEADRAVRMIRSQMVLGKV